jgi:low temperature requirement protein LtrA
MLGLVWWSWSGFTWMTNSVDIESPVTKLLFLAGMGGAFFVALAVPHAYRDQGAWFAVAYVFIRALNLALDIWGLRDRPAQLAALLRLAPFFAIAPGFVLAGGLVANETLRTALWAVSIAVDLVGVLVAGNKNDWRVSPAHFAERYALIVIIALGESISRLGSGTGGLPHDALFALSVSVAFAGVVALWWAYFGFVSAAVERALRETAPTERGPLARDVFSIFHYPVVLGIVFFAVAAKKVIARPGDPLSAAGRAALGLGVALFLVGFLLGRYRVVREISRERAAAAALALLAVVVLRALPAVALLAVVSAVVAIAGAVESEAMRSLLRGRA